MRMRLTLLPILACALFLPALAAEEPKVAEPDDALRKDLKLSPFYKKAVVVDGFAVVASDKVSDYAILEAAYLVNKMLAGRDDIRRALVRNKVHLAVMAPTEFTIDIPEHSDLKPAGYWNKRARGLGATGIRPAVSCGEENLLNYEGDPYRGENILVHEFGHAIHEMGMRDVDRTFDRRLNDTYKKAMSDGLWKSTYAATNRMEYWAEGVQSWFDCNRKADRSQHNGVNTREKLKEYDPPLAKLLEEVFKDNEWRYVRPDRRKEPGHLAGYDPKKAPKFAWPAEALRGFEEAQKDKKK